MHCGTDRSAPATSADDTASGWRGEAGAPGGGGITDIGIKPLNRLHQEGAARPGSMDENSRVALCLFSSTQQVSAKEDLSLRSRITIQDAKGFFKMFWNQPLICIVWLFYMGMTWRDRQDWWPIRIIRICLVEWFSKCLLWRYIFPSGCMQGQ